MRFLDSLNRTRAYTAERPRELSADAAARYQFAATYVQNKSVIDVGCGLGQGSLVLANAGARLVLGLDYSIAAVDLARGLKRPNLKFRVGTTIELQKLKQKFDSIICLEVLEHIPLDQVSKTIASFAQILKKGGKLVLSTPNGLRPNMYHGELYNPYHVKEYTPNELRKVLSERFNNMRFLGITWKNNRYQKIQGKLNASKLYQLAIFLGHFKIVREFLAFVPKNFKQSVTGENNLPTTTASEYRLIKNYRSCDDLFIICRKK